MEEPVRSTPNAAQRVELAAVLLVAFGPAVLGSVASLGSIATGPAITGGGLLALVVQEVLVFALLATLLRLRGWTRAGLGLTFRSADVAWGLGLFVAGALLAGLIALAMPTDEAAASLVEARIPLNIVLLASAVNPVFEEVFVCGYLVAVLKPWKGAAFAINASTALRLAYHLYQGTPAVAIIPLGLLFALWFARTGRLWPVILAHAAFDVIGLAATSG